MTLRRLLKPEVIRQKITDCIFNSLLDQMYGYVASEAQSFVFETLHRSAMVLILFPREAKNLSGKYYKFANNTKKEGKQIR